MSTSAYIVVKFAEKGKLHGARVHWDGDPAHTGHILQEHYTKEWKLRELMRQGWMSSIRPYIGKQHHSIHDYDEASSKGWSTFWQRDMGRTAEGGSQQFDDLGEALMYANVEADVLFFYYFDFTTHREWRYVDIYHQIKDFPTTSPHGR